MHETDDFILPVTRRTDKIVTRSVDKQTDQSLSVQGDTEYSETSVENSPQKVVNEETDQTDQVIIEANNQIAEGGVNDQVTKEMTTGTNEVICDQTDLISVEPNTHSEQKVTSVDPDRVITESSHEEVTAESSTFPVISQEDCEPDDEFADIYRYADSGELAGNSRKDKTILIMADRYVIDDDGLLYRMDLPRDKCLAKLKPVVRRLCVPRQFRHEIVKFTHEQNGHYAAQGLFHALATCFYWKSLFTDASKFCKTCEVCQRTKVNFGHRFAPLNPVAPPDFLGSRFSMDHKTLTRQTTEGYNAVLVIVECFSGFAHLIPVPDMTALTTAKAIVRHIIPFWGQISCLYSDKGPGFVSSLFRHISDLVGIKQITSG